MRKGSYKFNSDLWVSVTEWSVPIPDIRHCSEHAILQRLWRHPAHRQQALPSFSVVICLINVSCHAKIWREKNEMKNENRDWESHETSLMVCGRKALLFSPLPPLSVYIRTPPATGNHWNPNTYSSRSVEGLQCRATGGEAEDILLTWPTSNLHSEVLGHHAVPGSQISVDKFVGIQVRHAVGDFPCHLDHLFEGGQDLACGILQQRVKSNRKHSVFMSSFLCISPHTLGTGHRSA